MLIVAVLVGLAVCQVAIFVTTVFLHRALAHRSVTLSRRVTMLFRIVTWVTTGIRPRQWVAVHRKHHAFTDVEGDPHSPILDGYLRVQLTNAAMYRKVARDPEAVARYARDLPPDRWDRMLFDHALVGLGIGVGILVLAFGWQFALVVAAVHMVTYLTLNAAINAVGHYFGSQPYDNTARNNQWLALITAGEGLHNNHHAASTSAKLALSSGEIDPGWWLVKVMQSRKWAAVRHAEVRFKAQKPRTEEPAA